MIDRINLILKAKNMTARQFAEEIGVQQSGLSHVLSGRNNPSLDFVMKIVRRFPEIDINWLLFGKGEMFINIHKEPKESMSSLALKDMQVARSVTDNGKYSEIEMADRRGIVSGLGIETNAAGSVSEGRQIPDLFTGVGDDIQLGVPDDKEKDDVRGNVHQTHVYSANNGKGIASSYAINDSKSGDVQIGVVDESLQPYGRQDFVLEMPNRNVSENVNTQQSSQQGVQDSVNSESPAKGTVSRSDFRSIERIVVFYRDKTFAEYFPEKQM